MPRAELLERKLAEVERGLTLTVDGREAALRQVGEPRLSFPPGAGGLDTTRLEVRLRASRRLAAAREGRGRHLQGSRRLEGDRRRAGRRHRGAHAGAERRPDERAAPLSRRPPEQPARPTRGVLLGDARRRHADRAALRGDRPGVDEPHRQRRLHGALRARRGRRGRPVRAAARGLRLGGCARAVAGSRQGNGRRLPRRHEGQAAARGGTRRDGHDRPHHRRLHARLRHARAVAVRAAGGPLPVAQSGLGRPGRGDRRRSAARAPARARALAPPPRPRPRPRPFARSRSLIHARGLPALHGPPARPRARPRAPPPRSSPPPQTTRPPPTTRSPTGA